MEYHIPVRSSNEAWKPSDRYALANILSSLRDGTSKKGDKLVCVETNFQDVVQQGEERSERKRRHENRDETELNDYARTEQMKTPSAQLLSFLTHFQILGKESILIQISQIQILFPA